MNRRRGMFESVQRHALVHARIPGPFIQFHIQYTRCTTPTCDSEWVLVGGRERMFVSMSFLLDVGVGLIRPASRIAEPVDLDHLDLRSVSR